MQNFLRKLLVMSIVIVPCTYLSSLSANKKEFAAEACISATPEEKQLLTKILVLFRKRCVYEKELIQYDYMPEDVQQRLTEKIEKKQSEINEILDSQENNTCFINKMVLGVKKFQLQCAKDRIKTVDALLEELSKK